jgi:hypothetical protein
MTLPLFPEPRIPQHPPATADPPRFHYHRQGTPDAAKHEGAPNNQPQHIAMPPPVRRTAPATSHEAALRIADYTAVQSLAVLGAIAAAGDHGATDAEVQAALGLGPQSVGPRRGELRKRGLVCDSGERRQTPSGRRAIVWVATAAGRAVATQSRGVP